MNNNFRERLHLKTSPNAVYRAYAYINGGYEHLGVFKSLAKAKAKVINLKGYEKYMIIEHDPDLNMDSVMDFKFYSELEEEKGMEK